jgi:hypothetical protein
MDFLSYLQTASPRLPGMVSDLWDSGEAVITCELDLPLSDGGTVDRFWASKKETGGCDEGAAVSYTWKSPGQRGINAKGIPANPIAVDVRVISDEMHSELTNGIRRLQLLFLRLSDQLSEMSDLSEIIEEFRDVLVDPDVSVAVAFQLFIESRQLTKSKETLLDEIEAASRTLGELEGRADELKNREIQVRETESRLAPAVSFATAIGLELRPTQATPGEADHPSLDEIEEALGSLASPLVRRTAVVSALTSMINGRLLLLDGPVGTGKSSLAEALSKALGGAAEVLPVRPAWIEPADLTGYYDPLSRVFRPGPLLDALDMANDDRTFVLVLDELNLARIENYGADLLSRLERIAHAHNAAEAVDGLPAWSQDEYHALKAEWGLLEASDPKTAEDQHRRERLRRTLRFLPKVALPSGMLLAGTLNTDDTTYDLSPKVIDRSFALAFPPADLGTFTRGSDSPSTSISVSSLRLSVQDRCHGESTRVGWNDLLDVCPVETMSLIGVPFSHRVREDFEVFAALCAELSADESEILPMFLFSRVLPRIRFWRFADERGVGV